MFNFNEQNKNYMGNPYSRQSAESGAIDFETLQDARKDLVGELDAIIQYDYHAHTTNNKIARETWENIRDEEIVHVGELLGLLYYLAPYQKQFVEQGLKEFEDRLNGRS